MFDLNYYQKIKSKKTFLAGVDEVGRGPLAGPVVAACVLIEIDENDEENLLSFLQTLEVFGVTDSKKIKSSKRKSILEELELKLCPNKELSLIISENLVLKYYITEIGVDAIDRINILNASLEAMRLSFEGILPKDRNGILLIDGNKKFKTENSSILETVIKGDTKSLLIGLASIIAKEYRDELMQKLASTYPFYFWELNAGYGTQKHLEAIKKYGVTRHHRKTFKGVKEIYAEGRTI